MLSFGPDRGVRLIYGEHLRTRGLLPFWSEISMIDEGPNRNVSREFDHTAVVVRVEMRNQQVIDRGETGVPHRGHDSACVAAVVAWESGVDEQRLPSRCDDERRLTALNIDEIDVERVGRAERRDASHRQGGSNDRTKVCHAPILLASVPGIE